LIDCLFVEDFDDVPQKRLMSAEPQVFSEVFSEVSPGFPVAGVNVTTTNSTLLVPSSPFSFIFFQKEK